MEECIGLEPTGVKVTICRDKVVVNDAVEARSIQELYDAVKRLYIREPRELHSWILEFTGGKGCVKFINFYKWLRDKGVFMSYLRLFDMVNQLHSQGALKFTKQKNTWIICLE